MSFHQSSASQTEALSRRRAISSRGLPIPRSPGRCRQVRECVAIRSYALAARENPGRTETPLPVNVRSDSNGAMADLSAVSNGTGRPDVGTRPPDHSRRSLSYPDTVRLVGCRKSKMGRRKDRQKRRSVQYPDKTVTFV